MVPTLASDTGRPAKKRSTVCAHATSEKDTGTESNRSSLPRARNDKSEKTRAEPSSTPSERYDLTRGALPAADIANEKVREKSPSEPNNMSVGLFKAFQEKDRHEIVQAAPNLTMRGEPNQRVSSSAKPSESATQLST